MLLAGGACSITWQSSGPPIDYVNIEYSPDTGQNWVPIESNAPNTHLFDWNPVASVDSTQCLVRISDKDDPETKDASNSVFVIFECLSSLIADLNGDCYVDFADFVLFCQQWLTCGNPHDPDWCWDR